MISNIAVHVCKDDIEGIEIICNEPKVGARYWTIAIKKGAYIYIEDAELIALLDKISGALMEAIPDLALHLIKQWAKSEKNHD